MEEKLYTGEVLNGGTVTGTLHINDEGKHFNIVKHEGVTSSFSWQVKPETVKGI